MNIPGPFFALDEIAGTRVLRLVSRDRTNRLTTARVSALTNQIRSLAANPRPLIITGNSEFFSAGADLNEIAALTAPDAYAFSGMGQDLMNAVASFPATVYAAITGYCMGGGLDLALACHRRIAAPNAMFGHRGAALGLITGWGGTQRLPRLVGRARALQMFVAADKIDATEALRIGLIDSVVADPLSVAAQISAVQPQSP
jgi:enoyl-CoA hydratase/carnithine racemase